MVFRMASARTCTAAGSRAKSWRPTWARPIRGYDGEGVAGRVADGPAAPGPVHQVDGLTEIFLKERSHHPGNPVGSAQGQLG